MSNSLYMTRVLFYAVLALFFMDILSEIQVYRGMYVCMNVFTMHLRKFKNKFTTYSTYSL